jgi:hypothetical protein
VPRHAATPLHRHTPAAPPTSVCICKDAANPTKHFYSHWGVLIVIRAAAGYNYVIGDIYAEWRPASDE